jgi:hypothetical protein
MGRRHSLGGKGSNRREHLKNARALQVPSVFAVIVSNYDVSDRWLCVTCGMRDLVFRTVQTSFRLLKPSRYYRARSLR